MDPSRVAYWERKMRSIRLGAEPIEAQLRQRLYATVVVTAVMLFIASVMLAIFAAFGRFDIGLRLLALSFLPLVLWFWLDYAVLRSRALAYLHECGEPRNNDAPPG
jgi:hypothetical protein